MTDNSKRIFNFLKEQAIKNPDKPYTAQAVADALGFDNKNKVNGAFTASIQRNGLGKRVEMQIMNPDGKYEDVKALILTEKGMAFDPDAEEA